MNIITIIIMSFASTLMIFLIIKLLSEMNNIKSDKSLLFYKMCLDDLFVVYLIKKLEKKGIEFCLEHGIPIHYMMESPPEITYAGQIRYKYNRYTDKNTDFDIIINYNCNKDTYMNLDSKFQERIKAIGVVSVIFHEIGHYLEIIKYGKTTEIGADLQGNRLMTSYCDDVVFKFLSLASTIFNLKDGEITDEDIINNNILFDELKYVYEGYKKNVA